MEPGRGKKTERLRECILECLRECLEGSLESGAEFEVAILDGPLGDLGGWRVFAGKEVESGEGALGEKGVETVRVRECPFI